MASYRSTLLGRSADRERETRWATDAAEAVTLDELLPLATVSAKMLFRCPVCVLLLVKQDCLCVEAAAGLSLDEIQVKRIPLGKSLSGRLAKRGSPRVFRDVSDYLATIRDNAEPYYSGPLASAPLVFGKQVIGLLNICRPAPATPISNEDLNRLLTYANQTAFAIVSQRRVDQRTEELHTTEHALLRVNERLGQDIAERKRIEQALRESERNYRTLFESTLDGVAVIDAETMKIVVANEAAARLYGFTSATEAIGLHPLDFLPPDERDRVIKIMSEDMFEKDLRLANEFRTLTRDGRDIWISAVGARTEYKGRLAGLVSLRDITDAKRAEQGLRESEERLRALVENAPSPIIVTDLMGNLADGNRKAEELTGYSKDEMLGKNLLEMGVFSGASLTKVIDALEKQRAGQPSGPDEFELTRKDGSSVFAEITAIPVDRSGQVEVISIARDMTERKKAEDKERQYIRDLMFLSESATELVEFPPQRDIYQFIGQRVKDFVGDCAVVMSTFDDASGALRIRTTVGLVEQTGAHPAQTNGNIVGLSFPLNEAVMRSLTSGRLQPVPGGLHELCAGGMSKDVRAEFETANAIAGAFAIGIASNGKLFGSAAILTRRGAAIRNPSIIETFARQASVALQRRSAEEELRRARDGLELRVQERTAELATANEGLHAEIAERQRVEESLRQSEYKLRAAFESARDAIIVIDINTRIVDVNEICAAALGCDSKEQLIGRSVVDIFKAHADGRRLADLGQRVRQMLREEGYVVNLEFVTVAGDGTEIPVEANISLLKDETEQLVGAFIIVRNVSERKKAEEKIREREKRYRFLYENSQAINLVIGLDGVVLDINQSAAEQLGYTKNELLGRHILEFVADQQRHDVARHLKRGFSQQLAATEFQVHARNGSVHTVLLSPGQVPLYEGRDLAGFLVTGTDITERRQTQLALQQSEALLREAQHIAHLGNWNWDLITNQLRWSDEVYHIFGVTPQHFEATYEAFLQFVHPDDRESVTQSVNAAMHEGEPCNIKHRIVRPEGLERVVHQQAKVTFDGAGRPIRMAGAIQDVTEHEHAEEAVRTLIAQTQWSSATAALAAGVAHELNNPMMGMLNFAQYCLKHTSEDDRIHPVLVDMERETKRCADIVKNLLAFSRTGRENEEQHQKASLATVIDRVMRLLSYRIEREGVVVTQHIETGIPEIWMKMTAMQQVVFNLMKNALDALSASDRKEIRIEVKPAGQSVRLCITDSGPGIPPENVERIFEPFFTTKPTGEGTGLGLPINSSIVNEHGGTITCESEPGVSTTFTVLLPIDTRKKGART